MSTSKITIIQKDNLYVILNDNKEVCQSNDKESAIYIMDCLAHRLSFLTPPWRKNATDKSKN